jgi:hypothetical protein
MLIDLGFDKKNENLEEQSPMEQLAMKIDQFEMTLIKVFFL